MQLFLAFLWAFAGVLNASGPAPTAQRLAALLKSRETSARIAAARSIRASPPADSDPLLAPLLSAMSDPNDEAAFESALALGRVGSTKANAVLPRLKELLHKTDCRSRIVAALALEAMGPSASDAAPELVAAMAHRQGRRYVQSALARVGPPTKSRLFDLTAHLRSPQKRVRLSAANTIGSMGPAGRDAIDLLQTASSDPDRSVAERAKWAIARIGPLEGEGAQKQKNFSDQAMKNLSSSNAAVASQAAFDIGRISPAPTGAVAALAQATQHPDPAVAARATWALGEASRTSGAGAAQPVLAAMNDERPEVRRQAENTIQTVQPWPKDRPALESGLADPKPEVRAASARLLGRLGSRASGAVPALVSGLKDKNKLVARESAVALGAVGPAASSAVSSLIDALADPDKSLATASALALMRLGPYAKDTIEKMKTTLTDPLPEKVYRAERALGAFGPASASAVKDLTLLLDSKQSRLAAEAAVALGKIGPGAKEAVPPLIKALKKSDRHVAAEAARALGLIGPGASLAIEPLLSAVGSSDRRLASEAVEALGRIGPDNSRVVREIKRAAKSKDIGVAHTAYRTLENLGEEVEESHGPGASRPQVILAGGAKPWLILQCADDDGPRD